MSINFTPSLVEAMDASYTEDTFVRTLGFFAPGDGGAAVYRVTGNVSKPIADKAIQYTDFTLYCSDGKFHLAPDANHPTRSVFQLIPQNNTVYAEQFGVMPGDVSLAVTNITLLKKAVGFAASKGLVLNLGSKGIYYLAPNTISVPSNFIFDGNGGALQLYGESNNGVGLFDSQAQVDNVSIKNVKLIGRKISVSTNNSDQAIHVKATNLVIENVRIECFYYAIHTYGKSADFAYDVPEIQNKNWLISNCLIKNCIFGILCSEIDGMTVTNSDISGFLDSADTAHCIYLSCNCLNIRVNECSLHDISGDAIHKAYPNDKDVCVRGDVSKNHFYNDLSIYNVDSALLFGVISENVMCDNIFATYVKIALQLAGADNCIVSNSHLEQTQTSGERLAFIHVAGACNCWLQNSYVYHIGELRAAYFPPQDYYIELMFKNKTHRRMFIGEEFKTPNYRFKFTGCEMISKHSWSTYFYDFFNAVSNGTDIPLKSQFGEYWDNCVCLTSTDQVLFRLYCTNDLPGGLTIRNSYIEAVNGTPKAPFRYYCLYKSCSEENNICVLNKCCVHAKYDKYLPWLHLENVAFKGMTSGYGYDDWDYIVTKGASMPSVDQAVILSGSYGYNCFKMIEDKYQQLYL